MLRLITGLDQEPEFGWQRARTPLGASAFVEVNSPAWELCEDWRILTSGRVQMVNSDSFFHWFSPTCKDAPVGLVAELLAANNQIDRFAVFIAAEPAALAYIVSLPLACNGLDADERDLLGAAVDIARRMQARIAARAAVQEAMYGSS